MKVAYPTTEDLKNEISLYSTISNTTIVSSLTFDSSLIINLFSTNNAGVELNNVLTNYTGGLSECLANCSHQGICVLNSFEQYVCQCNQFRMGASCQTDSRPCSSNPCLNNGTCSNLNNSTSFYCTCQNPDLFYGIYCENKKDLCKNNAEKCFKSQGFCIMNETQPLCKCFIDYSGSNCEIMSTSLFVRKSIINVSTLIAILVLVIFIVLLFCFDFTKYFFTKNHRLIIRKQEIIKFQYRS
jgi:hypothetical protein